MSTAETAHGVINRSNPKGGNDYLFRVSLKAVVLNEAGHILTVREHGHDWWDLPGGGMDHGETIEGALARELKEEVSLEGDFTYELIHAEDPRYSIDHKVYQIRLVFLIKTVETNFKPGEDCNEIRFIDADAFKDSTMIQEHKIFEYSQIAKSR